MRSWLMLSGILLAVVALRLPPLLQLAGGQDEEWYGVPGLLVAERGIPSVPYSAATDPDSIFLGAEQALFAMPPLSFYAQAPFFTVLQGHYGTARLSSFFAALLAVVLIFLLGRLWFRNDTTALLAAGLFSCSRLFWFPAMSARPAGPGMLSRLFLRWESLADGSERQLPAGCFRWRPPDSGLLGISCGICIAE